MPSGLLGTLFNLKLKNDNNPLEDYLTEIFAYCLQMDRRFLKDFLFHFHIYMKEFDEYSLSTQYLLDALPHHDTTSRPDIVLFINNDAIFFENKIAAIEGDRQLARYAEHLDNLSKENKTLIYITRDFDPKDKNTILKRCSHPEAVSFLQIRWFEIFRFFNSRREHPIIFELLVFMKQIHLSMNNQFTPVDILTLTNFSKVQKMLDEIMYGEISSVFERICKGISKSSASLTQLRNNDRYVYFSYQKDGLTVMLGFWMNTDNEKEYPDVGIVIEVDPKSRNRQKIIDIFNNEIKISENIWAAEKLIDPSTWGKLFIKESLQRFLSEEDQVKSIKDFLIDSLCHLDSFFSRNKDLQDQ